MHIALRWNDTRGDTVLATRAITEMICDGVASFFGPEGPCHVEAIVSQSRNIPMISYVSWLRFILVTNYKLFQVVSSFFKWDNLHRLVTVTSLRKNYNSTV